MNCISANAASWQLRLPGNSRFRELCVCKRASCQQPLVGLCVKGKFVCSRANLNNSRSEAEASLLFLSSTFSLSLPFSPLERFLYTLLTILAYNLSPFSLPKRFADSLLAIYAHNLFLCRRSISQPTLSLSLPYRPTQRRTSGINSFPQLRVSAIEHQPFVSLAQQAGREAAVWTEWSSKAVYSRHSLTLLSAVPCPL